MASRVAAALTRAGRALSTARPVHPPPLFLRGPAQQVLSPWHDLPLRPAGEADPAVFNFVCEIPRGSRAKMEIATATPGNPLVQDVTKASAPRFYALDSLSNYGAIPQTYEDPHHADGWTGLMGDGDPIDVCEVGSALARVGGVYTVRVLGALAMVDDGETDWKVLAVRTDDALVAGGGVRDIRGAPDALLRTADEIREWFRMYKVPEGKGENSFALGGAWQDRDTTLAIIASTHAQWRLALAAPPRGAKGPWVPQAGWHAESVAQPPSKPSAELNVAWAPR